MRGHFLAPSSPEASFLACTKFLAPQQVWTDRQRRIMGGGYKLVFHKIYKATGFFDPLSFEEAVDKLRKNASAGYGRAGSKGDNLRKDWEGILMELDWIFSATAEQISERYCYKAIPKVEPLPVEKKGVKERVVVICTLLLAIWGNMLIGAFQNAQVLNWHKTDSATGVSKYYGEYASIFRWFHMMGRRVYWSVDIKSLEASMNAEDMRMQGRHTAQGCFDDNHAQQIRKFYRCLERWRLVLTDGSIVDVKGKNPSGHLDTIHVNSRKVAAAFWGSILECGLSIDKCNIKVIGDDLLMGNDYSDEENDLLFDTVRDIFRVKILGRQLGTPYGLPWLSMTVESPGGGPVSLNPDKMLATIAFNVENPVSHADVVRGVGLELANNPESAHVKRYTAYLNRHFNVGIESTTPTQVGLLYCPSSKGALKLQPFKTEQQTSYHRQSSRRILTEASTLTMPKRTGRKNKKKKGSSKPRPTRKALPTRVVLRKEQENARAYVRCMLNPMLCKPARRPTVGPTSATVVFTHHRRITLPMVSDEYRVGNKACAIVVHPNAKNHYWTLQSINSAGDHAWEAHSIEAPYSANFQCYRVGALGMSVVDTGAILNMGGSLLVGKYAPKNCKFSPTPVNFGNYLEQSDNVELYNSGKLPSSEITAVWTPIRDRGGYFYTNGPGGEAQEGAVDAITFREPTSYCADTAVVLYLTVPSTASDQITVNTAMHMEGIPYQQNVELFNPRSVMGSADDISEAFDSIMKNPVVQEIGKTGIKLAADHVMGKSPLRGNLIQRGVSAFSNMFPSMKDELLEFYAEMDRKAAYANAVNDEVAARLRKKRAAEAEALRRKVKSIMSEDEWETAECKNSDSGEL